MSRLARGAVAFLALGIAVIIWLLFRERPPRLPAAPESGGAPSSDSETDRPPPAARIRPVASQEAATSTPAAEPDSRRGPELRIRFVSSEGSPVAVFEAKARFEGHPVRAEIIADDVIGGGAAGRMIENWVGDPLRWRQPTTLEWDEAGAKAGIRLAPGRWRLFLTRPRSTPCVSAPISGDDPHPVAEVVLGLRPRERRVRFVEADSRRPLARARAIPHAEIGDDLAFILGAPVETDDAGEIALPLHEARTGSNERAPTWWVETATHLVGVEDWFLRGDGRLQGEGVLEIAAPRRAVVFGRAWLRSGAPAAGRQVICESNGRVEKAIVAADGAYRLDPVVWIGEPRGTVMLIEDLEKTLVTTAKFVPKPGDAVEVDLGKPGGGAALRGRITAGGQGLNGLIVVTRSGDGSQSVVVTGADGSFAIEGLATGTVSLMVALGDPRAIDNFTIRSQGPIEVKAESRPLDFALPAGTIEVTVLDDETGKPPPKGVGWAIPGPGFSARELVPGFDWSPGWGCFTDGAGVAVLHGLPEGVPHEAAAAAEGYGEASQKGVVPGTAAQPARVTIRIRKKG
jgi:hypothetical protein